MIGQIKIIDRPQYDSSLFVRHSLNLENIVFNAKLLSISKFEDYSKDSFFTRVDSIPIIYFPVDSNFSYLVIVLFNSLDSYNYYLDSKKFRKPFFDYIIIFSYFEKCYYKIAGFDTSDFKKLYDEINNNGPFRFYLLQELFCNDLLGVDCIININCYINKHIKKRSKYKNIDCNNL
jgi:hypothetical protein